MQHDKKKLRKFRELITALAVGSTVIVVGGVVLTGVSYMYKTIMTPNIDFRPVLDAITAQNVEYQKAIKKQNDHLVDIAKTLNQQRQQANINEQTLTSKPLFFLSQYH